MKYPNRTTATVIAAGAILTCSAVLVAGQAGAQEKQMTVAMITHAQPGDTFWDIIRKGAEAAAKKDNIRANSVHPGIMPPMRTSGRTADPAVRAERMRFIPMRRPGEVEEVAYTILFLASDESSYITGSEIHVDGGILAI